MSCAGTFLQGASFSLSRNVNVIAEQHVSAQLIYLKDKDGVREAVSHWYLQNKGAKALFSPCGQEFVNMAKSIFQRSLRHEGINQW